MATLRQQELAKAIINNAKNGSKLTYKDLLVSTGYSKVTAVADPKEIIQGKGLQEELKKAGFTIDEADNIVGFILKKGKSERNQLSAADMIYKRLSGYAPEKHITINASLVDLLEQVKKESNEEMIK